jgi:hypothetical protein
LNGWKELGGLSRFLTDPRQIARLNSILIYALLIGGSLFASYFILSKMGMQLFMMAVIGVFFGTIYTVISFGNLMIPFLVWILSVFGFRFLWSIQTPGLPDLFLDRMTMIWLSVVFFVKFFAEKRKFRGPYLLDIFMLINMLYIAIFIYVVDMSPFHDWTMSYLIPYAAFFFAKNLVTTNKEIRRFLWALLILSIYYNITSIAEKLGLDLLIWPKYILYNKPFWGRSNGPFRHAPLFGTVIGMMIPMNLYFLATVKTRTLKILLNLSLMMGFAGLYFTYTRGSWLAGIMALLVVAFLNRRHYLKMILPALVVAPFVAIMFLGIGQDKFMKERVENEDTLGSRLGTIVTATKVWQANPVFGVGINQYRKILDDYVEPLDLPVIGVVTISQFRHNPPHDIYFAFLAEAGAVGVALQGTIYFLILRTFLMKYRWRKKGDYFSEYILPVFGGVFAGYLAGGLAINYVYFSVVGTLFYSCAGIMYGYQQEENDASGVVLPGVQGDNNLNPEMPRVLRQPTSQVD